MGENGEGDGGGGGGGGGGVLIETPNSLLRQIKMRADKR